MSWSALRRRTGHPKRTHRSLKEDANHPESLDPIRSFLIDSGGLKALCTVICAKLFHRVGVPIVNRVNLNLQCALHTKFITDDTMCATVVAVKILISSYLFQFLQSARNFATTIERARQQFDFDRAIASHRVARCPSTRLLKRYRCFFARAVVNRMQCVSIPDAC